MVFRMLSHSCSLFIVSLFIVSLFIVSLFILVYLFQRRQARL